MGSASLLPDLKVRIRSQRESEKSVIGNFVWGIYLLCT
jgi:hypothetical protein